MKKIKNRLLVIVGPTASGKTAVAARLARKFDGEIVSADSRQVYRHMDIGTGKDRPRGVRIWGYDLVDPTEEFSVAKYVEFASVAIEDIWGREKLPILVGGTGLYVKAVIDGIETINVPREPKLRVELRDKTADELFGVLKRLDNARAARMNESDRKNKRRIVRAIEVAKSGSKFEIQDLEISSLLIIGLRADKDVLYKKIEERVEKRVRDGFEQEVEKLVVMGISWERQSMQALGYRQWGEYLRGEVSCEAAIEKWKREERKYAKRQMSWFKKDKRTKWMPQVSDKYLRGVVEERVGKWYSKVNDG